MDGAAAFYGNFNGFQCFGHSGVYFLGNSAFVVISVNSSYWSIVLPFSAGTFLDGGNHFFIGYDHRHQEQQSRRGGMAVDYSSQDFRQSLAAIDAASRDGVISRDGGFPLHCRLRYTSEYCLKEFISFSIFSIPIILVFFALNSNHKRRHFHTYSLPFLKFIVQEIS